MKKLSKLFKLIIVGLLWTYILLCGAEWAMMKLWRFDILDFKSLQIIADWWNHGGTIKTGRDFLFLASIILVVIIWLWGWKRAYLINFKNVIIAPFEWLNRQMLKKYSQGERIVIKNIGLKEEKQSEEDIIKEQLKDIGQRLDNNKESTKIREAMAEKINMIKK